MTVPGVCPAVSLTYRATVDVPARFRKSKAVGAVFALTCAKHQSGESNAAENVALRRRDDAGQALRSGPEHAAAFKEMALAQAWRADRQAPRKKNGNGFARSFPRKRGSPWPSGWRSLLRRGTSPDFRDDCEPSNAHHWHYRHRRSDLLRHPQRLYRFLADDGERGRHPHRRGARWQARGRLRLQFERPLCAARAAARALHSAAESRQAGRDRRRARAARSGEMLGRHDAQREAGRPRRALGRGRRARHGAVGRARQGRRRAAVAAARRPLQQRASRQGRLGLCRRRLLLSRQRHPGLCRTR